MSLILSMAAFALATSITPGPVNVVALSAGARFGFAASQKHVFGAAVGFTLLLVLIGLDVEERFFREMARAGILTNLVMWAFNLFPLPPLDGGRILVGLLPWKQAQWLSRIEPWGFFIVMGLVLAGIVGAVWLRPLMALGYSLIQLLLTPLALLLR